MKRCFKSSLSIKRAELHHFIDAADKDYGQCSYLRVIDTNDSIMCSLVMAKSRVTPVKNIFIPRLELAAPVLSYKVCKLLNAELCSDDLHNIYWCNNQIVVVFLIKQNVFTFTLPIGYRQLEVNHLLIAGGMLTLLMIVSVV